MKKLAIIACVALSPMLTACPAALDLPPPKAVADQTIMDEQGRIALGLAYVTASRLGNALFPTGNPNRPRFQQLDAAAYAALQRARAAYAAGNSASYRQAAAELQTIIGDINNLVGR